MLVYPVKLSKVGAGYVVTFRDIPEALTEGRTKAEALEMAADALATAMDFYFEDRRQVPPPSRAKKGEVPVALPASLSASHRVGFQLDREWNTRSISTVSPSRR